MTFNATNNPALTCIQVDDAAWATANFTDIDNTASFSLDCNPPVVYIPDVNFKAALVANTGVNTNLDAEIQVTEAAAYTYQMHAEGLSIADLTGIEAFTAITQLFCNDNLLTGIDLSANTALTLLYCNNNLLTTLDVSANTALTILHCNNNALTNLDVSTNTALTGLSCNDNSLTNLDVSANTALTRLYCYYNSLTSLNVAANTSLNDLECNNNSITSLDVSTNTALEYFYCNNNLLTSLDVSANANLYDFNCSYNTLTSLNLQNGNNTSLAYFTAINNPDLICIQVDNAVWATANFTDIDNTASFNEDCLTVGIPEVDTELVIYPNPASTSVTLNVVEGQWAVKIFNAQGQQVMQTTLNINHQTLNISALSSGVYYLSLLDGKREMHTKIIKQ